MENHIKAIERIFRVHELILQEHTGTPDELAKRIQISKRTLYKIIEYYNDTGTSIKYCRVRKTFYYSDRNALTIATLLHQNLAHLFSNAI